MYLRTLLVALILGIVAILAFLNWNVFMTQATLSVGITTVEAPLGLLLLGIIALLTVLFLIYIVYLQSSTLVESRRLTRELQAQRDLAENAETSRFHQLRTAVESALREQNEQTRGFESTLLTRLEELERDLRSAVEQSGNSIAAHLGEIEDRFERAAGRNK